MVLKDLDSEVWVCIVEVCVFIVGVMGGLGGVCCCIVVVYVVYNGFFQMQVCYYVLYGEKVGFGIFVQFCLEECLGGNWFVGQLYCQLLLLLWQFGLFVSFDDLGLVQVSFSELQEVCCFVCCDGFDLYYLFFVVMFGVLLEVFVGVVEFSFSSF